MLNLRQPLTADVPMDQIPLVEPTPIPDTWIDDIVEPVEIIGQGVCFRTTFVTLTKLDGVWVRAIVFKAVRPVTYQVGRLFILLRQAQRAVAGGLQN